ncbi:MAG: metalloregulator ArsR/SmtB family transcription factor [Gammaproteobacteria bacterium]|nr:metalloregulator ArsR/SmtB family transcription factor [Gammaproteobacteria bacterium]
MPPAAAPASREREATGATVGPVLSRLQTLADGTRVRVLLLLEANEFSVGEICRIVQLPQSTVSRHLGTLAQGGWVVSRPEGTSRYYRISRTLADDARDLWAAVRNQLVGVPRVEEDRRRARGILDGRATGSRAFFRSEAGRWDQLREQLFGTRVDAALLAGLLRGTEAVGDLGCGTGHLTRLLAPFARRVIAIDRSPAMLGVARRRLRDEPSAEVVQGDLAALPVESGALDLAVVSLVLHYVVDLEAVFAEVHRVLEPGGRVLIVEIREHGRTGFAERMGHLWLGFRPEALEELLGGIGFRPLGIRHLAPRPEADGPELFVLRAEREGCREARQVAEDDPGVRAERPVLERT